MNENIKIMDNFRNQFSVSEGELTRDLINRQTKLDDDEKETLLKETVALLSNCVDPESKDDSTTGIAIGYVQSGKTMSFTTLTALAADNGFRIVIYLAGIKVNLLEQTTKRIKKDLLTDSENSKKFKVYQSPTIEDSVHIKIQSALKQKSKPAILITVLKHYKHIDELTKMFRTPEVRNEITNCGVLIIDDEADQASLNTYARKNSKSENWEEDEFSSTYSSILNLRSVINNHSYIQYTATPQAPLLINILDLLSPKFHVLLTPGKKYTGGKTFFIENKDLVINIPKNEVYHHKYNKLKECPQSLIDALQIFLIGVAISVNILNKEKYLSMMIHADSPQDASKTFYSWVKELLSIWGERLNLNDNDPSKMELINEFKINYLEATKRIDSPPNFSEVIEEVYEAILDTNMELVIQGSKEINWSNATSHILVGADMLNRGFTVEGLAVTYMPRYSVGKSNADTIQQRCRFFGYKMNYLENCRVFIPSDSYLEYKDYVEHEEITRKLLKENSLSELERILILNGEINPTRNNVLSKDVVKFKLSGWRQFNALQHISENIAFIEEFLSKINFINFNDYGTVDRNHRYSKLDIIQAVDFLNQFKISNMPDALRKSSTLQYLRYLSEEKNLKYIYLFQMSYDNIDGRRRALEDDDGKLSINNIFSGRSTINSEKYPGDKEIKFDDSLCIQVHKIRLKHNSSIWDNRLIYTLGIYYPESFAHSFVAKKS